MNKKIAIILLIVAMAVMFTACNKEVFDVKYKFTNAYVKVGEDWIDVEVKTWTDFECEQIQITLKDGTVLVVNSMNCILYNGTLPTTNGGEATTSSETWEQRVIADACHELDIPTKGVKLQLTHSEYVAWLECEVYTYILTLTDGTQYIVGARENEDGFYCDVEGEI